MEPKDLQWLSKSLEYTILFTGIVVFFMGGILFVSLHWGESSATPEASNTSNPLSQKNVSLIPLNPEVVLSPSCKACQNFWENTIFPLMTTYPSFQPKISILPLSPEGENWQWTLLLSCAQKQGKEISTLLPIVWKYKGDEDQFAYFSSATGIAIQSLSECAQNPQTAQDLMAERKNLFSRGVRGTPTLFLAGEKYEELWPKENIELEILKRNSKSEQ